MGRMRSRKSTAIVSTAGAMALGVLLVTTATRTSPPHYADGALCDAKGRQANLDFTLKNVAGAEVSLSTYRGKVLLLDFWATWCAPCKLEIPGFVELYDKYKPQGLEVVGLLTLDAPANATPFAQQYKMSYPILDVNDRVDVETAFGPLAGLPTSLLIGRDGRVCREHLGYTPKEQFEAEIKGLL